MQEQEFQDYCEKLRNLIDAELSAAFSADDCPEALRQAVQYSLTAPGKRLRPMLVLMAADVCGGTVEDGLPSACAVEMVHTYSLIHDDLPAMDDDSLRRGRPTSHVVYGEALAILAGDTLLTRAFGTLTASSLPPYVIAECVRILSAAAGSGGMVGGQVLDLMAERGPFSVVSGQESQESPTQSRPFHRPPADSKIMSGTEEIQEPSSGHLPGDVEQLIRIHRMKTGALITASLELGAVVAEADADQRSRLEQYGECCGLAFQIADDLLDVTGTGAKQGKETGRDGTLGKLTYPSLLGIEGSRTKAAEQVESACEALAEFGSKADPLRRLTRFIVERDH